MTEEAIIGEPEKKPGVLAQYGYKDGKFSKTAAIYSVAWVLVFVLYALQSLGEGATLTLSAFTWTIPQFSAASAGVILGFASSTYVGNNYVKTK